VKKRSRGVFSLVPAACLALLSLSARAQEVATNLVDLAEEAFSGNHSLYLPWTPWEWHAYSLDGGEPLWVDCSQLPCADWLPASAEFSGALRRMGAVDVYGVDEERSHGRNNDASGRFDECARRHCRAERLRTRRALGRPGRVEHVAAMDELSDCWEESAREFCRPS